MIIDLFIMAPLARVNIVQLLNRGVHKGFTCSEQLKLL